MNQKLTFALAGAGAMLFVVQLSSGRATAQPQAGDRYQYQCATKVNPKIWKDDALKKLNELGAQGWRLLPSRYAFGEPEMNQADVYCFERRIP